ncbi:MAG: SecY family transport protein, partial [bacterium]|nr:SecY family transport protein [bacterium]
LFHNQGGGLAGSTGIPDLLPEFTAPRVGLVVLTLTAGTALLMWMGELITQKGIGNGMSIIIFAAVVSSLPNQFSLVKGNSGWPGVFEVGAMYLVLLVLIVFVEQGQRRIPVQFAKRVVGRRMTTGGSTYIPLKVNQSGVIPIIFASSVLYLPQLIVVVLPSGGWGEATRTWVNDHLLRYDDPFYLVFFGLLIIGFAYFYTAISFDPVKQADNIRKQGGFVPGIRPGRPTERYLAHILSRITLPGSLFLALIALTPAVVIGNIVPTSTQGIFSFTGISILIAVGVALETMKQIDSQLMLRNYEGFLK